MDARSINPVELAYHRKVAIAAQLAQATLAHWMDHLGQQYQLVEGDRIELDGTIVRDERRSSPVAAPEMTTERHPSREAR